MPYDRRTRRRMSMFAGNLLLSALALTLTLAMGCQRLSVSRMPDVALPPSPGSGPAANRSPVLAPLPASAPVPPPAATALPTGPKPLAAAGIGPVPLTQFSSQTAPPIVSPAPIPPAPVLATPLLDKALQRAKAAEAAVVDEPPVTMPIVSQGAEIPRFTAPAVSRSGKAPMPVPNVFLTESLPPIPPPAGDPKIDLKVEATTALVPAAPPRPIAPDRPVDPVNPLDVWREGLHRLRSVARTRAAEAGNESHDLWTLRAQLLDSLGEPENPTAPEDGALQRSVFTALVALAGPDSKSTPAPALSASIRAAVESLEDRTPFEITDLQVCRKVKRYGDYEPLEAAARRSGHALILYCEMVGVHYATEGGMLRSRLASRVEIVAPGGGEPVWTQCLGTADDLCRQRRRDFYVNYRMTLPDGLAPGPYELRLIQDDLVAGQTTTRATALVIAP